MVVLTLLPSQIGRLCKRAALGIGRCGSYAAQSVFGRLIPTAHHLKIAFYTRTFFRINDPEYGIRL